MDIELKIDTIRTMKSTLSDLEALLKSIGLTDQECVMFSKAYAFPGLTPRMLAYQCEFSRMTGYRVLERLGEKKLLAVREHLVYPISLHELSERLMLISSNMLQLARRRETLAFHRNFEEISVTASSASSPASQVSPLRTTFLASAETFKSIEKLHAPGLLQHAGSIQLLKSDAALEAFDDMHQQKWEWNIALGDFESYGQKTDLNFNKKWVTKRVKKGRKAKGVITAGGPFTKEFTKDDEAVLRKTCLVKNFIQDQWIETFPECGTTFIFSPTLTKDHTIAALKIQNKTVTDSYAQMVKAFLP